MSIKISGKDGVEMNKELYNYIIDEQVGSVIGDHDRLPNDINWQGLTAFSPEDITITVSLWEIGQMVIHGWNVGYQLAKLDIKRRPE